MRTTHTSHRETARPGPDWFTGGYAEEAFTRHLWQFTGQSGLRFLQIGAYAGDASLWLADNVLTGPGSMLVDVDTWRGSDEAAHHALDFDAVHAFYLSRLRPNVMPLRMTSDEFFHGPVRRVDEFDFIYVDGSHETHQVLADAVNAHHALRAGGLLAFDDYLWDDGTGNTPRAAVDAYLSCFAQHMDIVEVGLQVWVRKR